MTNPKTDPFMTAVPDPDFGTENDDEGPSACVLVFNANDPSGAGGITADITAIASVGAHALPISTGAYVRDTAEVRDHFPMDDEAVTEQARTILEDVPVQAFKVGFVGNPENLSAVAALASDYSDIPVITYMPDLSWWSEDQIDIYQDACNFPSPPCWLETTAPCAAGYCPTGMPHKARRHATSHKPPANSVFRMYSLPAFRCPANLSTTYCALRKPFCAVCNLNALRQCSAEPATRCLPR